VKAVLADILGHGNDGAILPGQLEARAAEESARIGGLIFTKAEALELIRELAKADVRDVSLSTFREL